MIHILEHSISDSITLIPFLFITYLIMEFLEKSAGEHVELVVKKAGRFGPIIGGIAGLLPQCGFAAAASNLYSGGIITVGTLLAIFLSTSDEMLPILISSNIGAETITRILTIKLGIAIASGFLVDFIWKRKKQEQAMHIHDFCEHEHCHCERGIFRSAIAHTLKIAIFIILITFFLNLLLHNGGEEIIADILNNRPILGPVVAGIVGLIPNCVSSVVLTQLYVEQAINFGTMMAGLLINAGVGLLVLLRINIDKKETFKIIGILYTIGVVSGIILQLF